jgi:hypothetical protein
MRRLMLLAVLAVALASSAHAEQCEDRWGNVYDLDTFLPSLRPTGPCLPVGTWDAIRDEADPTWRQKRHEREVESYRQLLACRKRHPEAETWSDLVSACLRDGRKK